MQKNQHALACLLCLCSLRCATAPSEENEGPVGIQGSELTAMPADRTGHAPRAGDAKISSPKKASPPKLASSPASPLHFETRLPWSELGLRQLPRHASKVEFVPEGPSALSVLMQGQVLLLDRLKERILRISPQGSLRPIAVVPRDAEDLASNAAGKMVALSHVRSMAWLFNAKGGPAGNLQVPRALRHLLHIELGQNNQVYARSGYQEIFELGLPERPRSTANVLASRKESAILLDSQRGAVVLAGKGTASLRIQALDRVDRRSGIGMRDYPLGSVTAARLLGHHNGVVCLRTESRRDVVERIEVRRKVQCLRLDSGSVVLDVALPAPGLYLPKRELVFRHGWLAFMHPLDAGLELKVWRVAT